MEFFIKWSIFFAAFLVFGCIKFLFTKNTEDVVIYLPNWFFCAGAACVIVPGAAFFYFPYIEEVRLAYIVFSIFGAAMILCQLNQKTTMISADTFRYQTMFGRKKIYSFSDIIGVKIAARSSRYNSIDYYILMKNGGKLFVENSTVKDTHFMSRVRAALQEQGVECEFV